MVAERVVLVHGLWLTAASMWRLGQRLRTAGFVTHQFGYPSTRRSPRANAQMLAGYLRRLGEGPYHLVCHSLGGLLARHLLELEPHAPVGRLVLLGTPQHGSRVAQAMVDWPGVRVLLGQSVEAGLLGELPPWRGQRELGVIAGALPVGVGRVLCRLPAPHDGTVSVAETRLEHMSDHIVLPVSHTGLLLAASVAHQVEHFLTNGRFAHRQVDPMKV